MSIARRSPVLIILILATILVEGQSEAKVGQTASQKVCHPLPCPGLQCPGHEYALGSDGCRICQCKQQQVFQFSSDSHMDAATEGTTGCNPTYAQEFTNVGYIFKGYDVLYGYPDSKKMDPGFRQAVFRGVYDSATGYTTDCRYKVPDGLEMEKLTACSLQMQTETVKNMKERKNALKLTAEVSTGMLGFEFSASLGFQRQSKKLSSGKNVLKISHATCTNYAAKHQLYPPPLASDLVQFTKKIIGDQSQDAVFNLFEYFGTHFITQMSFGARYLKTHQMSTSNYEVFEKIGFEVGVGGKFAGAGGGADTEKVNQETLKEFQHHIDENEYSYGSPPPKDGHPHTWALEVEKDPLPIQYAMKSIDNIFTPKYFKGLGFNDTDLKDLRGRVKAGFAAYCPYLIKKKKVSTCSDPGVSDSEEEKKPRPPVNYISVENGGQDGDWGTVFDTCSKDNFASGFRLKVEEERGRLLDDTALNAITLRCRRPKWGFSSETVSSLQGPDGDPGQWLECPPYSFIIGFTLKVEEEDECEVDCTGANNIKMICKNILTNYQTTIEGDSSVHYGDYGERVECDPGTYVCGIKTRVDDDTGLKDDTGLNDVQFKCCPL